MPVIHKMQKIAEEIDDNEKQLLSSFAVTNDQAIRKEQEKDLHFRPPFTLDRDRIFYSGAFSR